MEMSCRNFWYIVVVVRLFGRVAQLGERRTRTAEAVGSTPISSTNIKLSIPPFFLRSILGRSRIMTMAC